MVKDQKKAVRNAIGWREAAREYGFPAWAMYQAFTNGEAPSFTLSGKLYCMRPAFEKWLESLPGVKKRSR